MRKVSDAWIIHIFALLHAAAAILCRLAGFGDTIFLTTLTMTMTVILCLRGRLTVEVSAICIIIVNIVGYVIGIAAAAGIELFWSSDLFAPALSTFLTTELLGWGLVGLERLFHDVSDTTAISDSKVGWLAVAVAALLVARILIGGVFSTRLFSGSSMYDVLSAFVSNTVVLLVMVSATIIFLQMIKKGQAGRNVVVGVLAYVLFFVVLSSASALLVAYMAGESLTVKYFFELLVIGLICEAAIYSFVYMIDYAMSARRSMEAERDRANQAKSQYINLKNQVNPHFLFNSLNILDYLVAEKKTSEAREYIRGLAGLYRYMLRNENEPVVRLSDELEYAGMYADLLKVRFPNCLEINYDIASEDYSRFVVTYSVQMLLENAIKHNAVSPQMPLSILVSSDGNSVTVSNNRTPKLTPVDSTGVGLDYIRRNYLDRSGREVRIVDNEKTYSVSLPLL